MVQDTPMPRPTSPQWTWRAIGQGCLLGTVMSCSNFYMGLNLGWTFGSSILGAVVGFTMMKGWIRIFGGPSFSPQEHATLCSAATAAGSGTVAGYISGIPAMYRLGLMGDIIGDLPRLGLWALAASMYGIFFAIPLRKYFVIKQNLPFPTPTVTAGIIKSLHATGGEADARTKTRTMALFFCLTIAHLLVGYFILVVKEWHFFYWIYEATKMEIFQKIDGWRMFLTFSWAFFGAGMMTPPSTATSFFGATILFWPILGTYLVSQGLAPNPKYFTFGNDLATKGASVRFWLLWPGIMLMVVSSFAELGCRWRTLWNGVKGLFTTMGSGVAGAFGKKHDAVAQEDSDDDDDPAGPEEQVPVFWWVGGVTLSTIFSIVIMFYAFDVTVGETILAIVLGFIFAFIAIQSSGETDINPTGSIAKTSQGFLALIPNDNLKAKQTANLSAGLIAAAAAHQSSDMVGDLKTGHLVGASPRSQFIGQFVGSLYSIGLGIGLWVLFAKTYPCITDSDIKDCPFGLVSVASWEGVTRALTGAINIPASSAWTSLALGLFTAVYVVIKNNFIPSKYHPYLPNMNAVGIALVNPQLEYAFVMFAGSIFANIWNKRNPKSAEMYVFAIASGLIAGEGIFGIVTCVLNLAGITEDKYAISWGMPKH